MTRYLLYVVLAHCLFSCGNNDDQPKGVMNATKMQAVLWDVIRAESFTNQFIKPGQSRNALEENALLQKRIFAIHQVSREDFYRSFDYYKENGSLLKVIMDSMINKAGREKTYGVKPNPAFSIPGHSGKVVK